jgi:hypothetical protein
VGGDALEEGVEVALGELPLERCGDLLVVLLEGQQAGFDLGKVLKSFGARTLRCRTEK